MLEVGGIDLVSLILAGGEPEQPDAEERQLSNAYGSGINSLCKLLKASDDGVT